LFITAMNGRREQNVLTFDVGPRRGSDAVFKYLNNR